MPQSQCALPCWALPPARSDSRPLSQASLKCPGLVLGPETAPGPVPAVCRARSHTPSPAQQVSATWQRWRALPSSACHPPTSPLLSHHPRPPLPLTLPLVFLSFLQTRQATKVLNPTRVPKASPPATTMPSSGTSTREARSPADCPLVSLQVSSTPDPDMPRLQLLRPCPRWLGTTHPQDPPMGLQALPFHSGPLHPPEGLPGQWLTWSWK